MGHVVRTRQGMEQGKCGKVKAKKEIGKVTRELWLGLGKKGNRRGKRETVSRVRQGRNWRGNKGP